MTSHRDLPADSIATPREGQLASCLRRLLDTTELNMDDMEEETREAIRAALCVLRTIPPPDHGT
jgi:hypothetical protein